MSKESLDYEKLCCNYYSSWEDGCCMESCEYYHRDECPIIYVKELLAKKDDKISTLEKQLADTEAELAEKEADTIALDTENYSFKQQIDNLRQQLDEKEEQVEKLQYELELSEQDLNECAVGLEQKYNQDKTSFAVEQLSKTKNFVNGQEIFSKFKCESKVCRDILQAIDNQIKQLTHQHEDKGEQ